MPHQESQQTSLSTMLERLELANSLQARPSSVFRNIILMMVLVMGIAHIGMQLNHDVLASSIANSRFAELQIASSRLTDNMNLLRNRMLMVPKYGLVPELLKAEELPRGDLQAFLVMMRESAPQISNIHLVYQDGEDALEVGQISAQDLHPDKIADVLSDLAPNVLYHSPMRVESNRLLHWMMIRVQNNHHGIAALVMEMNHESYLPNPHQLGPDRDYDLLAADYHGQVIGGTTLGLAPGQSLGELYPGVWTRIKTQNFGKASLPQGEILFLRLEMDNDQPLYLLNKYQSGKDHPWQKRYTRQIAVASVFIMLMLASLIWRHQRQRDHHGAQLRAEALAAALFQGKEAVLLFSLDGRCQAANAAANNQLSHCHHLLQSRRFRHLFDCDTMTIDMVWQLTRSSQNWQGVLKDRALGHQFDASLRLLNLQDMALVLVTLENQQQLKALQSQLKTLENLSQTSSGLALVDEDLKVVSHNPALANLLRLGKRNLVGEALPELVDGPQQAMPSTAWQGVTWYQRGDGSRRRALISLSAEDPLGDEAHYRVFTITPYLEARYLDGLMQGPARSDVDLSSTLATLNGPASLMVISIAAHNMLEDGDELLFRQHQVVRQLEPLLPQDALIGTLQDDGEICLLLPGWSDRTATQLARQILDRFDSDLQPETLTIGLVLSLPEQEWPELLASARDAVVRARLSGLPFCQANTRTLV